MRTKANWARRVVAIFMVTFVYSFACSTTCAVGFCPNQAEQRSSHDCEPTSNHQSHHSSTPAPDCSKHAHPTSLFVKSAELSKVQLVVSDHTRATAGLASLPVRSSANSTGSPASDLAPPFGSSTPLYQQVSVLRI